MLSTVTVTTQPAKEPVSVALARQHCRIDHSADDELLAMYIRTARTMAEMYLSRALITQTINWTVTPESLTRPWRTQLWGDLVLPRGPVQSVSSVVVQDSRGNTTTLSPATLPYTPSAPLLGYMTDLRHSQARLRIGLDTVLSDNRALRGVNLDDIQVTFAAGYATDPADLPAPIVDAVLLTTACLYEHRGDAGGEMPVVAEWLLNPYRVYPI